MCACVPCVAWGGGGCTQERAIPSSLLPRTSCCADAAPPAPGLEPCSRAAMNDMACKDVECVRGCKGAEERRGGEERRWRPPRVRLSLRGGPGRLLRALARGNCKSAWVLIACFASTPHPCAQLRAVRGDEEKEREEWGRASAEAASLSSISSARPLPSGPSASHAPHTHTPPAVGTHSTRAPSSDPERHTPCASVLSTHRALSLFSLFCSC